MGGGRCGVVGGWASGFALHAVFIHVHFSVHCLVPQPSPPAQPPLLQPPFTLEYILFGCGRFPVLVFIATNLLIYVFFPLLRNSSDVPGPSRINAPAPPPAPPTELGE